MRTTQNWRRHWKLIGGCALLLVIIFYWTQQNKSANVSSRASAWLRHCCVLVESAARSDNDSPMVDNRALLLNEATGSHSRLWLKARRLQSAHPSANLTSFALALDHHASHDNWVLLALVDQGCLDMAINFHDNSLHHHRISNYLMVSSDYVACEALVRRGIHCYMYVNDKDSAVSSIYQSKDFLRKMHLRTFMILDALRLGFNVLHTDVDVVFLQNPFADFQYNSHSYDIAALIDWTQLNAGFLFIRNTSKSIAAYEETALIARTKPQTMDQAALNRGIKKVVGSHKLALTKLPVDKYLCGHHYWDDAGRNFVEERACDECVVVHNNWIVSMEAKRYRFRELQFWSYDPDGYYSDVRAKYVTFDNEVSLKDANSEDLKALQNALAIGEILNRTVILPKFHCKAKRCTILDHLKLRYFEAQFKFKENSFLTNELVPKSVKNSKSDVMAIKSDQYLLVKAKDTRKDKVITEYGPKDPKKGATSDEIKLWFGSNKNSVLRFDNLLGSFSHFMDKIHEVNFREQVKSGFVKGRYLQK